MKVIIRLIPESIGKPIFAAMTDYKELILFENGYLQGREIILFERVSSNTSDLRTKEES